MELIVKNKVLKEIRGDIIDNLDLSEVNIKEILRGVFYRNDTLVAINFPEQLKQLGSLQFTHSSKLRYAKIDESSLREIPRSCFKDCKNLECVELPKSVKIINDWAFKDCMKLSTINLNKVKRLETASFKNCISLVEIDLSEIENIGPYCFENCKNLKIIKLNSRLKYLDEGCFKGCKSLREIIIQGNPIIDNKVFQDCKAITVICDNNSTVEEYCKQNKIDYDIITSAFKEEVQTNNTTAINKEKSSKRFDNDTKTSKFS